MTLGDQVEARYILNLKLNGNDAQLAEAARKVLDNKTLFLQFAQGIADRRIKRQRGKKN